MEIEQQAQMQTPFIKKKKGNSKSTVLVVSLVIFNAVILCAILALLVSAVRFLERDAVASLQDLQQLIPEMKTALKLVKVLCRKYQC
jgi:hypothetical protein